MDLLGRMIKWVKSLSYDEKGYLFCATFLVGTIPCLLICLGLSILFEGPLPKRSSYEPSPRAHVSQQDYDAAYSQFRGAGLNHQDATKASNAVKHVTESNLNRK